MIFNLGGYNGYVNLDFIKPLEILAIYMAGIIGCFLRDQYTLQQHYYCGFLQKLQTEKYVF